MAGQLLEQLYVDVTARNLQATMRQLKGLARPVDQATDAMRRYKRQIEDVNRTTISGARLQGGGGGVTGLRESAPNLQGQLTARGGVGGAGGMAGMASQMRGIATAATGALAAVAGLAAIVKQGFSGTTELAMFADTMQYIARELAALFAPALQLATALIRDLLESFRGLGNAGQLLLGRISPIGIAMEVLANPAVQSALRQMTAAFGELLTAAQPLLNLFANIGTELLTVFVVEPLVNFVRGLTLVVTGLKEVVKLAVEGAGAIASLFGYQRLMQAAPGQRRTVTLNATGTEDAQGTFQRLQQAVLKAGQTPEKEQEDPRMTQLIDDVHYVAQWFRQKAADVKDFGNKAPNDFAEGAIPGGVIGGLPGAIGGGLLNILRKRLL